jgi:Dolichyl-phosphate-mannose-protein mannosyltransferase
MQALLTCAAAERVLHSRFGVANKVDLRVQLGNARSAPDPACGRHEIRNVCGKRSPDERHMNASLSSALVPCPPERADVSGKDYILPSRLIALVLILCVAMAAWFRLGALDASGFAEDEIDILRAVESYQHFDFAANAEHPMLAKLLAFGSLHAADEWNHVAPRLRLGVIKPETALRFPVAFAGVLTTLAIFLFVQQLFDAEVGLWAALLWALDVNATGINRLGKEDTLLVFFFFVAAWLFERGKRASRGSAVGAQRWYTASGAAFGLMTASKYMPHYLGLHGVVNTITGLEPGERFPRNGRLFLGFVAAFFSANFALLLPATWRHILRYLHGGHVIHTGYVFAHQIYLNTVDVTPWGIPPTFYLVFLATKVPVLVLAALAAGLVPLARHSRERGFIFIRVFLLFFLLPYSLIAAKFVRYILPLLAFVDILAAVGIVWGLRALTRVITTDRWRRLATAAGMGLFAVAPLYAEVSSGRSSALYQNAVGAQIAPPGYFFPDDEFNDSGVREAVALIVKQAGPGAVIASDAVTVVAEYLARAGRSDLQARSIAHDGLPMNDVETWMLVQDGHRYFENEAVIAQVEARGPPWREVRVHGALAVQVYQVRGNSSRETNNER